MGIDVHNLRVSAIHLVINGSFQVDQRNDGAELSITSNNKFSADRWTHNNDGHTYYKTQRKNDGPIQTIGTEYYMRATVTTAVTLSGSTSQCIENNLEGNTVRWLNLGTSGAKQCTVSFWVRCSLTGTFGGALVNSGYNRCHPFSYTISSANTWEYKTLTFPGATDGTWGTDNGRGFSVRWCMGVGSTRQGTVDTYNGNESHGTSKQTNLFATNGATFYITGMQLEEGNAATSFEHRSYGEELALCQRYFLVWPPRSGGIPAWPVYTGSSQASAHVWIPHTMRTTPTPTDKGTGTSTTTGWLYNNNGQGVTTRYANGSSPTLSCGGDTDNGNFGLNMHFGSYGSGGHEADIASWNGTSPGIFLNAEL